MEPVHFEISLPLGPQWGNIELLRAAILNCLAAMFREEGTGRAVSVIVGELLENAVKYGHWQSSASNRVGLRVSGDAGEITVEVTNPAPPDPRQVEPLLASIAKLKSFATPRAAYQARIREVAEAAGPDPNVSRLGLARIYCECNGKLTADCKDGVVRVHVTRSAT